MSRLVLMLQFCTGYPQADGNGSATKREHDTGPSASCHASVGPLSPSQSSGMDRYSAAGRASHAIGAGGSGLETIRKSLSPRSYPERMIVFFRPVLLLLNATLIVWLGYYVFNLPGDPLGYALLFFLSANLAFLLFAPVRPIPWP
jgi:hypothetical protein